MIQVIIVDDERAALIELKYLLKKFEAVTVIGMYTTPSKVVDVVISLQPQVVFLDIEMPKMNGFELAEKILEVSPNVKIVFTTAFDEYAIRAFDINAVDYILKPISEKRLEQTVMKLIRQQARNEEPPNLQKMLKQYFMKKNKTKISVWKGETIMLIDPKQIIYCKAAAGDVTLYTKDGVYRSENSLADIHNELEQENFFRCHRSYLINLDEIKVIEPWFNNTYIFKMNVFKEEIPISRRHMKEFREIYHI